MFVRDVSRRSFISLAVVAGQTLVDHSGVFPPAGAHKTHHFVTFPSCGTPSAVITPLTGAMWRAAWQQSELDAAGISSLKRHLLNSSWPMKCLLRAPPMSSQLLVTLGFMVHFPEFGVCPWWLLAVLPSV